MKPIFHNVQQRSPEWFSLKCGATSCSILPDICARTKTGWGASRENKFALKVQEKLTGTIAESYQSEAMQWGIVQEPNGRNFYSLTFDVDVQLCGVVSHATIPDFLASPDGLVGNDGLVEIKCPQTNTMIDALLHPDPTKIPNKYLLQCMGQLSVTQREWVDLFFYDPRLPVEMQMLNRRIYRDEKLIKEIEDLVLVFNTEVNECVERLRNQYSKTGANDNDKGRTRISTSKRASENSGREELLSTVNV